MSSVAGLTRGEKGLEKKMERLNGRGGGAMPVGAGHGQISRDSVQLVSAALQKHVPSLRQVYCIALISDEM
jgi:hypothetical protein